MMGSELDDQPGLSKYHLATLDKLQVYVVYKFSSISKIFYFSFSVECQCICPQFYTLVISDCQCRHPQAVTFSLFN